MKCVLVWMNETAIKSSDITEPADNSRLTLWPDFFIAALSFRPGRRFDFFYIHMNIYIHLFNFKHQKHKHSPATLIDSDKPGLKMDE